MLFFRKVLDKFGFNWLFLFSVILVYFIGFVINPIWGKQVGRCFILIFFKNVLPVLLVVYIFIFIFNVLIDKKFLQKFLQNRSYLLKLIICVLGGIISSGSVYLWYPFLKKIKDNGFSWGHIASFIYARAIKIPLIPMMIAFFGLNYTIIFNMVILIMSFVLGLVIDFLWNIPVKNLKEEKN